MINWLIRRTNGTRIEEQDRALTSEQKTLLDEHWKLIYELKLWRNGLRGAATLLGISITGLIFVGFTQLPQYLDLAISSRISSFENLYLASLQSTNQAQDDALVTIKSFSDATLKLTNNLNTWDLSNLSRAQRQIFFKTLVNILANNSDISPNGKLAGSHYWNMLLNNHHFKDEILDSTQLINRGELSLQLGWCYIRHSYGEEAANTARHYTEVALEAARTPAQKRYRALYAAIAALLAGSNDVSDLILQAIDWRSLNEPLEDFDVTNLVEPLDIETTNIQWQALHLEGTFHDKIQKDYLTAVSIRRAYVLREKIASTPSIQSPQEIDLLIARANETFARLAAYENSKNQILLDGYISNALKFNLNQISNDFDSDRLGRYKINEDKTVLINLWQDGDLTFATIEFHGEPKMRWRWRFGKQSNGEWILTLFSP